jgi:hypothetical protein
MLVKALTSLTHKYMMESSYVGTAFMTTNSAVKHAGLLGLIPPGAVLYLPLKTGADFVIVFLLKMPLILIFVGIGAWGS